MIKISLPNGKWVAIEPKVERFKDEHREMHLPQQYKLPGHPRNMVRGVHKFIRNFDRPIKGYTT